MGKSTSSKSKEYGLSSLIDLPQEKFDAIILAVAHDKFKELNFEKIKNSETIIYDVKGVLKYYTHRL